MAKREIKRKMKSAVHKEDYYEISPIVNTEGETQTTSANTTSLSSRDYETSPTSDNSV